MSMSKKRYSLSESIMRMHASLAAHNVA